MPQTCSPTLRLMLVDDHDMLRHGMKSVLREEGFDVVGEASNGHEAIRQCQRLDPDIVVLDIGMPLLNGIDAAREMARSCPRTKIVLLTMHTTESYVSASLRAGIKAYVLKSKAFSELVSAIEAVMKGEVYLSPGISQFIVEGFLSKHDGTADPLSTREREVLQLIAEGKSMKDVGDFLGISARTAESHRANIMQKLDIHEIAGLVRYAIRQGLTVA
jgi:two-component system, NarL family, response regulator NreC